LTPEEPNGPILSCFALLPAVKIIKEILHDAGPSYGQIPEQPKGMLHCCCVYTRRRVLHVLPVDDVNGKGKKKKKHHLDYGIFEAWKKSGGGSGG